MTPRISRRRRSASGAGLAAQTSAPGGLGLLLTTVLLAVILAAGPLVLGSARLWVDLPILGGTAVLLLVQGLRLAFEKPAAGHRRIDAIDLSVLLFVIYAIVRWLTSPVEYFSRVEVLDVTACAVLFFTGRYGMINRQLAIFLLYVLVILGVGEAAFGYYFVHHLDWFPFGLDERLQLHYAPRWLGTYGCPNHYGLLLVMAIGATLALVGFSKLPWPIRIILFYLALLMMIGVLFSASRGSWLALVAAVVALVVFGLRNGTLRWWVPVISALAFLGLALGLFSLSPIARTRTTEFFDLIHGGKLNTYVRVELARDALHIAHDHPLWGTGPGTFTFVHPRYQDSTFAYKAVLTHDDYLNCLDDYGLVGFGLAMLFVCLVTLKFFRPLELDHRWQDRVLVATGFAAWAALLVHSLVDFNLHIPANARMFFALVGLALGRFKAESKLINHWSTVSLTKVGRGLGYGVILFALGYGLIVAKTAWGDLTYESAFTHMDHTAVAESQAGVQLALERDPSNPQALTFLGDLHRYHAARQNGTQARFDEAQQALDAYEKAAYANPLDDTLTARLGMTYDLMHRHHEAFLCYTDAVTRQPYDGQFWYRLGNHYWARGLLQKAEQAYLLSMQCPHGFQDSAEAETQLRQMPQMDGVPLPPKGTNPLTSPPETGPANFVP